MGREEGADKSRSVVYRRRQVLAIVMQRMWFLRIFGFGFGCEITKSADSDIDKSSHEEFAVNKNVGFPTVLHGFQLSKH